MDIELLPLSLNEASSVTGVQHINGAGVQLLAAIQGRLYVVREGSAKGDAAITLGGDASQAWDARRFPDGAYAAVYTQAGSAVCWIMSKKSGTDAATRLNSEAFAVYLRPRYVKGQARDHSVTAILKKDGRSQVVLFARPATGSASTRPIGDSEETLLDARLLRDSDGYWLFTLRHVPEEIESVAPRTTGAGTSAAGLLHAVRLDSEYKASGLAIRVFSNHPVYEFDVDSAPNGQVAIFATTPAGAIYARGLLKDSPLPLDAWKETSFEHSLSSPSLLVRNGVAHVAAVAQVLKPGTCILRGEVK